MAAFASSVQLVIGIMILFTGESQTATTTTTTDVVMTSTGASCVNTISDCDHHRREEICEGIYKSWAMVRCARYCGFCTGPGTDEPCDDTIPNCNEYRPCNNPAYFVWVADHCLKYCNRCGSETGTTHMAPQSTPQFVPTNSSPSTAATASTTASGTTMQPAIDTTMGPATDTTMGPAIDTTMQPAIDTTMGPAIDTTQGGAISTAASSACNDKLAWCGTYSTTACQDQDWAISYCPSFCNVCQYVTTLATQSPPSAGMTSGVTSVPGATTSSGPSSACQDQLSWCGMYSKKACEDVQWGRTYCAGFCDLCQN